MNEEHEQIELRAVTWEAPEYEHVKRSADWYWSLWIITISLTVTAIVFGNVLLGILLILSGFSITLFGHRKPRVSKCKIDGRGIYVGENFYPYTALDSFWIEEFDDERSRLIVKSQKKLVPYIIIPVEGIPAEYLREVLDYYLPEEEHHEPIFTRLMEYLGF